MIYTSHYQDVTSDLRKPTKRLDADPFEDAGFKYIPPGNYVIQIGGCCYTVFTDDKPGRGVIRDGVRLTLRFVEGATAEEIKATLEDLEAGRC